MVSQVMSFQGKEGPFHELKDKMTTLTTLEFSNKQSTSDNLSAYDTNDSLSSVDKVINDSVGTLTDNW